MTFCTVHNTQAGPRGCTLCQRDEQLMRANESRRFWRGAALIAVPFVAVLAAVAYFAISRAVAPRGERLDPRPYRAAIEDIESGLYSTERLGFEAGERMRQGLRQLPLDLRRTMPSLAQRRALEALDRYCVMTAVTSENAGFDVPAARKEWEELRAAHFTAAPWFRTSSAALEQAQQSDDARGIPGDVAQYQATIDQLRLAAARAEVVLQSVDDQEEGAGERWRSGRADLKADMDRILQQAPIAFPGMDPTWRRAQNELEKAAKTVGGMLGASINSPSQIPYAGEGRYRVLRARGAIESAEAALSAARR